MLTRQLRGGRLPLPASVRELDDSDEPALAQVRRFVDALCELPRAEWLEIGRRVCGEGWDSVAHAAAWAALDAAIAEQRLGVAAWHVRDAVETACFLATRADAPLSRSERRVVCLAREAAEETALALLVRPHLSQKTIATLSAPFRAHVQVEERAAS